MTPKGKCDELIDKYRGLVTIWDCYNDAPILDEDIIKDCKQCALIVVDEMLVEIEMMKLLKELKSTKRYLSFWQQVKDEINNL